MKSLYPLQHRFAGILLLMLGAFLLFGWMIGSELMVRTVPGSPAVAINTALMLFLGGVCLVSAEKKGRAELFYLMSAGIIVALSLAILGQTILHVDFGIDWAATHAALGDGHSHPGRTAPNACIAFLFAGVVFILNRKAETKQKHRRISLILSGLVLAIGILALLGYVLHLEAIYQLATYNRMAVLTAVGTTALGVGVWSFSSTAEDRGSVTAASQSHRITRLSATLLTVFAVTAGFTGFAILRHGFEESSTENLHNTAKNSAYIISSELENGLLVARSVANRTILKGRLSRLEASSSRSTLQSLHNVGEMLRASGFSGIQILDSANEVVITEGNLVADQALIQMPLKTDSQQTASLLWHEGYLLRSVQEIVQDGQRIGGVITEWPLKDMTGFVHQTQQVGKTSDVFLCGQIESQIKCFPGRFDKTPIPVVVSGRKEGLAFPISQALMGESGSYAASSVDGALMQTGFAPLPEYGLGLVVKRDVLELYAPLRDRLHLLIGALLAFVAIGTFLFRSWVQPLVEQIVSEQRRIKAILNNSNDAFVAVGADGLISDWNLQAEKTLGWTANEAIGQDLATLIIPADQREAHNRGFYHFLSSGTGPVINRRVEVFAIHKQGHEIPVELSVGAFHNGKAYGASAFIRDLTELKLSERMAADHAQELEAARAALVQSQKLEAVGKLTGGVAHDFNNVLQVVQGSLQLLQLENANCLESERRILTAMTAVDRGAKLSSQLLAFARKQPLQPKVINLAHVIHSMGDMLQRALGEAIDVEIIAATELWNTLVDPNQLENVILNLSINSRDAMQGEGKLTIEVGNSMLDEEYVKSEPGLKAGQFIMLAISDTGPGMSEEILERVFEPFFTTKPEGEGTGLGLSMAHGFVKQSEGHIKIYSEIGHGTTIRIYLPRSLEPATQNNLKDLGKAAGGTETILVVEDDPAVQATVVDILTELGYKVYKADNAESALELLQKERAIDLLFTDVVMPGNLRSPDLARQAKELIPSLAVLFTSGYTQNAIIHGGRLDPGVHLISKPYGRDQLARKIRELLSSTARKADPGNDVALTTPEEQTKNLKIALVEDNADFRTTVAQILTMSGYQVESFDCAESAISQFEIEQFDVLLTDMSLPGMSGMELASQVRQTNPEIKIILASGYGAAVTEQTKFAVQLLPKPFSIEQLMECLNTV